MMRTRIEPSWDPSARKLTLQLVLPKQSLRPKIIVDELFLEELGLSREDFRFILWDVIEKRRREISELELIEKKSTDGHNDMVNK